MEFAGIIQKKPDPPGIDKSVWIALITARDDLVPPEPLAIVNPFTTKPATIYPPETSAILVINGQDTGSFGWAENEENAVIVFGDLAHVRTVADEIARKLDGVFLTSGELE